MSRKAEVYYNSVRAGFLEKKPTGTYIFRYDARYLADTNLPAISLSFPKRQPEHQAQKLTADISIILHLTNKSL